MPSCDLGREITYMIQNDIVVYHIISGVNDVIVVIVVVVVVVVSLDCSVIH